MSGTLAETADLAAIGTPSNKPLPSPERTPNMARMSRDCEVIVIARGADEVMRPLTQPDEHRQWHQCFEPIPGMDAWAVDFWRLNWSGLLPHLEQLPWPIPGSVQVLLRDQDDDCFGLWMMHEGKLKEVPLPCTVREADDVAPLGSMLTRTDRDGCSAASAASAT